MTLCPFLPILRFLSLYTEQPGSAIKRKKRCKLKRKQNIPCKHKNIRERPFMSLPDDCDSEIDQLILCRKFYTVYHITKYKSSTFLLSCYTFRVTIHGPAAHSNMMHTKCSIVAFWRSPTRIFYDFRFAPFTKNTSRYISRE